MGYRWFLTMHQFCYDLEATFRKTDFLLVNPNKIEKLLHISLIFYKLLTLYFVFLYIGRNVSPYHIYNRHIFAADVIKDNKGIWYLCSMVSNACNSSSHITVNWKYAAPQNLQNSLNMIQLYINTHATHAYEQFTYITFQYGVNPQRSKYIRNNWYLLHGTF